MFFIRGFCQVMLKFLGYLLKEEYLDLGRKWVFNFFGEREYIYDIFKKYDYYKRQKFLFDEIDLV